MIIGIIKENNSDNRVAVTPGSANVYKKLGINCLIEENAGNNSLFADSDYENNGVSVVSRNKIFSDSDVIITINGLNDFEYEKIGNNKILITGNSHNINIDKLITQKITLFSLDLLPRKTLAQSMDILSSMATVSGYKAIIDAANHLPRFLPMFMTASGTIKPAKVLILGAGVAGLQALATARRLGAVVEVFDVRSAVKEEVNSLGGKFIEIEGAIEDKQAGGYAIEQQESFKKKQSEIIHSHAIKSDIVLCSAQIPGKKAPLLLYKGTVELMQKGSVIVDLAAPTGGNCELTKNNEIIKYNNITIIGNVNYPSMMPMDASKMFSNNVINFVKLLTDESGKLQLNWENEIVKDTCLTHNGEIIKHSFLNKA